MGVFSNACIIWKYANGLQAEQGSVAAAIRRHHCHYAFHGRRPKDRAQRLLNLSTRERDECVLHDVDAFTHRKKFFDFCFIDSKYFHCGRKDITLRIVSEAHAKQGASSGGASLDYLNKSTADLSRYTRIRTRQNCFRVHLRKSAFIRG